MLEGWPCCEGTLEEQTTETEGPAKSKIPTMWHFTGKLGQSHLDVCTHLSLSLPVFPPPSHPQATPLEGCSAAVWGSGRRCSGGHTRTCSTEQ